MNIKVEKRYDDFPSELDEFIEWLSEKLSDLPQEYKHSACIEIGLKNNFCATGFINPFIVISHYRPETLFERHTRISKEDKKLDFAKDIEEIKRLAKKHKVSVETIDGIVTISVGDLS